MEKCLKTSHKNRFLPRILFWAKLSIKFEDAIKTFQTRGFDFFHFTSHVLFSREATGWATQEIEGLPGRCEVSLRRASELQGGPKQEAGPWGKLFIV